MAKYIPVERTVYEVRVHECDVQEAALVEITIKGGKNGPMCVYRGAEAEKFIKEFRERIFKLK